MKSIDELTKEHDAVRIMLDIMNGMALQLERDNTIEQKHIFGAVEFAQVFVDSCHHSKEEDFLFPVLQQAGKKVSLMQELLGEHEQGRRLIKDLKEKAADIPANSKKIQSVISEYTALIDRHIEKENNDLFAEAEECLSDIRDAELYEAFERIEQEEVGEGRHEEFHALLKELSEIYRV